MNFRRPIQIGLLAASVAIGTPVLAQQGGPQSPADHGAHHGAVAQQESQQTPGGGMGQGGMGQGGMGQGGMGQGGMMGQGQGGMMGGMMGQDGKAGGQGMMGCPMMGKGMMGGGMMGKGGGMMHSRPMMEARLAYIKADLDITEAQESAWNAYADAVRARHAAMEGPQAEMMKAKESGTAVEQIDARIKATEAKLDSLKATRSAVVELYAVLTDEQKGKANKLLGGGCGMM